MFLQELYYIPTKKIHHYTNRWSISQSVILSPCSRIQQWTSIFHLTLIKIAKQTYMNGFYHSTAVWFLECIHTNLYFRVISNTLLLIHHRPLNHVQSCVFSGFVQAFLKWFPIKLLLGDGNFLMGLLNLLAAVLNQKKCKKIPVIYREVTKNCVRASLWSLFSTPFTVTSLVQCDTIITCSTFFKFSLSTPPSWPRRPS